MKSRKKSEALKRLLGADILPQNPEFRWGHGKPGHPYFLNLFASQREAYRTLLSELNQFSESMGKIPLKAMRGKPHSPHWDNVFLRPLDGVTLYGLMAHVNPSRYVEVGSGHSTRFARRAIEDLKLRTRITSIDPNPRVEIDRLCDETLRSGLEDVDLSRFKDLEAGDFIFVDGSHRVFTNSDVTVVFFDILPILRPGVIVHFHDIFWPGDYPPDWAHRYYSEQYLLGALLLGQSDRYEVLLSNAYIGSQPDLLSALNPIWKAARIQEKDRRGYSFWLRIR